MTCPPPGPSIHFYQAGTEPPAQPFDRIYKGKLRPGKRGHRCRIVCTAKRFGPNQLLIEFEDGLTTFCGIDKVPQDG